MPAPTPAEVRSRLDAIRVARGFVLPHHGAMAAALPELHVAYEGMYRALTLDPGHMAPLARESVWLAILAACEEPVGTHHLAKFRAAGGTEAQAAALFRLAAWAAGASRWATLEAAWQAHLPGVPAARAYLDGAEALLGGTLRPALARLCLAAVQAAADQPWGLACEIEAAYAAGAPEPELAEALSLVIWPRGVNRFVRACEVWLGLIRAGRVVPSPAFAAWAEVTGQGPLKLSPEG
jgi:alkylhydroperoxidase/carboxymuconolactone decarboxylase family protein YurZ